MTATIPAPAAARDAAALTVACPPDPDGCGAAIGDRCTSPSGRAVRPHTARKDAALTSLSSAFAVDTAGTTTEAAPDPEPTAPSGPTDDELVLQLLVLKVLAARVAEADADARDATVGRLDVGVSLPGYLTADDAAAARRGERDRCLGKVGLSRPSMTPTVTDEEALTQFVLEHAPDEIEQKPKIRKPFLEALKASAKARNGHWLNPATGELLPLPGVKLQMGRPTLQVRPSAEAPDLVAEALAAGLLSADGTRALPAGGQA
jgi:hypothetical protein